MHPFAFRIQLSSLQLALHMELFPSKSKEEVKLMVNDPFLVQEAIQS